MNFCSYMHLGIQQPFARPRPKNLFNTRRSWPGAQPALHFGVGQFSWNFIRWRHRTYSSVLQFFANGHK